jgi:Prokaryotic E2 family A/ThiF family
MTNSDEVANFLNEFPSIVEVSEVGRDEDGRFCLAVCWVVSLPKKYEKAGVSSTGVRDSETVYLEFPADYPSMAPSVALREDFPTNLPHIYPHRAGARVRPCVADVSLSELLHARGLMGLLEAVDEWLKNAAANELHDPQQGWEPVRLDHGSGALVQNCLQLREDLKERRQKVLYYKVHYFVGESDFILGSLLEGSLGPTSMSLGKFAAGPDKNTGIASTAAIVLPCEEICDSYTADHPDSFSKLLQFANRFGLRKLLEARYKQVVKALVRSNHRHHEVIVRQFFVVFAVKRPYKVIGANDDIELFAYRVDVQVNSSGGLMGESLCSPIMIQDVCTPRLLSAVSGEQEAPHADLTVLGCGSLGSKISLHLAKMGGYTFHLVDHSYLSMHNNARHGLIETGAFDCIQLKSELLAKEISKLGVVATSSPEDVRRLERPLQFGKKSKCRFIVDTTASLAVRHHLSNFTEELPGRLGQAYLLNRSRLGVLLIEGENRNPRVDDLNALLYQMGGEDDGLLESIYGFEGPQANHFAEGCGSFTTRMSDIDISVPTSSIAGNINQALSETPNGQSAGILNLTMVGTDYGTEVSALSVAETRVYPRTGNRSWEVRVLDRVVQTIEEQSHKYPSVENGGLLVGQYDTFSNTVYISGIVDAPEDTERAPDRLVLGTKGLEDHFIKLAKQTHGKLAFMGTWHSHVDGQPPSQLDMSTLGYLRGSADFPIVMLLRSPMGLELIE